jgi:predicted AAA+ superfamily ATPase
MIPRLVFPHVQHALGRQAAVALISPRQVGKTTLALEIGQTCDALVLDLEDRDDRNLLANPALFLESFEDRLVILDEIHRMPELFPALRGVIDRGGARVRARAGFCFWDPHRST